MMAQNLKGLVLASSLLMAAAACAPANPEMGAPPEVLSSAEQVAPVTAQVKFQPKVDILFVIDTSESMTKHIQNLSENIGKFVDAFDVSGGLDFQIAVVSVFDSKRFGPVVQNFYPLGKFRPVKGPGAGSGPQFVTRSDNFRETLRETLLLGIERRCGKYEYVAAEKKTMCVEDLGGPEFEELFTPVMAALDPNSAGNPNLQESPGFLRSDAHLAVIMLTDANDASLVQPTELADFMWQIKGRDSRMYSTYAALVLSPNQLPAGDERRCVGDPSGKPAKVMDLVKVTGGEMFDLCPYNKDLQPNPDFGTALGGLGAKIQEKASSRVRIPLETVPDLRTLKVSLGGQELLPSQDEGFTYDPNTQTLIINGQPNKNAGAEATLSIEYVPLAPGKVSRGRVIPIGH